MKWRWFMKTLFIAVPARARTTGSNDKKTHMQRLINIAHGTLRTRCSSRLLTLAACLLLGACAAGPDYQRPDVATPAAFKEMQGWKTAQPQDQELRGKWWEMFGDPLLNALEEQVEISNQNLAQAEAQYRQAQALVRSARAGLFPSLSANVGVDRSAGGIRGANANTSAAAAALSRSSAPSNNYSLSFDAGWEPDLWGRLRRTVEANRASAEASAADLQAARLSAQAQLAQDYLQLRVLDAQQQLLEDTIATYQKSLQLTQNQYAAGVVAKVDVIQAQTQLKSTQAQALDVGVQRAQMEHAIALLAGQPASTFSIARAPNVAVAPAIPAGVPSALLERRPDIAGAERRMAAANAQIGVARAAWFPALTLSASAGFQSSSFADWLSLPNRIWSLGPALAQTLFDAGLRRAQSDAAIAAYDADVAAYRQTVLAGFSEVEDNLAALRILEHEAQVQNEALQLARQSVALTLNQYKAGTVSYLNVATVQATALASENTALGILNRRLAASVLLIKALGGGWHADLVH